MSQQNIQKKTQKESRHKKEVPLVKRVTTDESKHLDSKFREVKGPSSKSRSLPGQGKSMMSSHGRYREAVKYVMGFSYKKSKKAYFTI